MEEENINRNIVFKSGNWFKVGEGNLRLCELQIIHDNRASRVWLKRFLGWHSPRQVSGQTIKFANFSPCYCMVESWISEFIFNFPQWKVHKLNCPNFVVQATEFSAQMNLLRLNRTRSSGGTWPEQSLGGHRWPALPSALCIPSLSTPRGSFLVPHTEPRGQSPSGSLPVTTPCWGTCVSVIGGLGESLNLSFSIFSKPGADS